MVLPAGFSVPPPPHLAALVVGIAAVGGLLARERPPVTERAVLALVPWMVAGSGLHVLYQLGAAPPAVAPLLGAPAVYLTTFVGAGAVWLAADRLDGARGDRALAGAGTAVVAAVVSAALAAGGFSPAWPVLGVVAAAALTALAWGGLRGVRPDATRATGRVGLLVVFGHALDGTSTAIGVDVLGFGERTPAARAIMEVAGGLPAADLLGVGWLFVLVKLAVAAAVVWLFADYVREEPGEGYLLLGTVAAVGLGPGAHNVLLYTVA